MRKHAFILPVLLAATGTLLAAKDPVAPLLVNARGEAAGGYDVVTYFESAKAEKGLPAHQAEWKGAKWLFTSAGHRDRFLAQPEKFAPQFGGYCAWAVGHNYTAPADPEAWTILNGQLYLNYNRDVQKKWTPDAASWIEKGDANWPKLHR